MPKTLVIPDVHLDWKTAEAIIAKENPHKVYFLGDIFDQFNDTVDQNYEAAVWLKEALTKYHFCLGNHDVHYGYHGPNIACSGYDIHKDVAISKVMKHKDWVKMKFYYWVEGWLLSHAGLHVRHIPPLYGTTLTEWLEVEAKKANVALNQLQSHWFLEAGQVCGGTQPYGGLIWCRTMEFMPIRGVNQIFGHTIVPEPRAIIGEDSINICLDTRLRYYALIEDMKVIVKEVAAPYTEYGPYD